MTTRWHFTARFSDSERKPLDLPRWSGPFRERAQGKHDFQVSLPANADAASACRALRIYAEDVGSGEAPNYVVGKDELIAMLTHPFSPERANMAVLAANNLADQIIEADQFPDCL